LSLYTRFKWPFNSEEIERFLIHCDKDCIISTKKINSRYRRQFVRIIFIYVVSIIKTIYFYLKQYFFVSKSGFNGTKLLLSTGRGYDLNNIKKLSGVSNEKSILINAYCMDDYMSLQKTSLFVIMLSLFNSIREYQYTLKSNIHNKVFENVLNNGVQNIPAYTYLRAFFVDFIKENNDCIIYTSNAILASHAAILSGFKVINLYHGLMGAISPNTYPEYHSIYVYSEDEREYLLNSGIESEVCVYPYECITNKSKSVIFFMADNTSRVESKELLDLIHQFKSHDYSIVIKIHPLHFTSRDFKSKHNMKDNEWDNIFDTSEFEILSLKDKDGMFVIKERRPSFVVGWHSTALCEALNSNVIPILMNDHSSRDHSFEIYHLERRSLLWPSEYEAINNLLSNYSSYEDTIHMLKTR
jgi:hypothetical protein